LSNPQTFNLIDLNAVAGSLPQAWKSLIVGEAGGAQVKTLRMDGLAYPEETHDFNEGLLVIHGQMKLKVAGARVNVDAGQMILVQAGVPHSVLPGSHGTLVIIDV
jgi:mannose-6-phosphate isomerase-like protein (cupin superfamily)